MTPEPAPNLSLDQRVATLTATVDQLQAERDRDAYAVQFLLLAVVTVAAIVILEHRRIVRLLP